MSLKSLARFADGLDVEVVDLFAAPRRVERRNPGRAPKRRSGE